MIIAEVALYLRVTEKTVYRLLKQGRIPATKVDRQWRFSKASIDKWLHESSVGSDRSFLIIDDEETIRALFKETLEEWGHNVVVTSNGSEGLELVKEHDFGLVFLDLNGYVIRWDQNEALDFVLRLAVRQIALDDAVTFLRDRMHPKDMEASRTSRT